MTYIYFIDKKKFTTNKYGEIPWKDISSFNENKPAWESIRTGNKFWCKKGRILHRLTGPAQIWINRSEEFWLNGKYYETVKEWINDHPNPDLYFDTLGMSETDKFLWHLQN
jgi:hypothetical protein